MDETAKVRAKDFSEGLQRKFSDRLTDLSQGNALPARLAAALLARSIFIKKHEEKQEMKIRNKRSVISIGITAVVLALAIIIGSTFFNVPPLDLSGAANFVFTKATATPTPGPTATSTPTTILTYAIVSQTWTNPSGQVIGSPWEIPHTKFYYEFNTSVPHGCTVISDDSRTFKIMNLKVVNTDAENFIDTLHGTLYVTNMGETTLRTQCPSPSTDQFIHIITTSTETTASGTTTIYKLQTQYFAAPLKVIAHNF